jgi:uncharacterized protein (UPF0335 family)
MKAEDIPRGKPKTVGVVIAALLRKIKRLEEENEELKDKVEELQTLVDEYKWVIGD